MTTLDRLLREVHPAVFDKDPGMELVLRVGHAQGAIWRVAEDQMVVKAGATGAEHTYNLAALTVAGLATALQADGFTVTDVAPSWGSRSAVALIEGGGNSSQSGGGSVAAFTSLLWVLMSSYAPELREAQRQAGEALNQMYIPQAEGEWLDIWGNLYGVGRTQGEVDAPYSAKIRREAFRERVNARAIELAIKDETGWDVRIEEPWREMFQLDNSRLSGGGRFYDGDHVGYHLIRPEALDDVDWAVVLPIIARNKPAGVIVVDWAIKPTRIYKTYVSYTGREWRGSRRTWVTANDSWHGLTTIVDVRHTTLVQPTWGSDNVVWGGNPVDIGV